MQGSSRKLTLDSKGETAGEKKRARDLTPVLFFLDSALGQGLKPIAYCSARLALLQPAPVGS